MEHPNPPPPQSELIQLKNRYKTKEVGLWKFPQRDYYSGVDGNAPTSYGGTVVFS